MIGNRNFQLTERSLDPLSSGRPPRAVQTARGSRRRIGAKTRRTFEGSDAWRQSGTMQLTASGGFQIKPSSGEATGRSCATSG